MCQYCRESSRKTIALKQTHAPEDQVHTNELDIHPRVMIDHGEGYAQMYVQRNGHRDSVYWISYCPFCGEKLMD